MNTPLHELTEDQLITEIMSRLRAAPNNVIGIGDDCAVLPGNQLLKTDCVIEEKHYTRETSPAQVGRKAIARVMSDMAAMGGVPEYFLVTCGLRSTTSVDYIQQLYSGMDAPCKQYGGYIVGGETCSIPDDSPQFFSITGHGICKQPILRSGAILGDDIYVTGKLGNSFNSGHHLNFTPRLAEAAWLIENAPPSAMMDLSDGLARDLPRLANASRVGYHITRELLPLRDNATIEGALTEGEDYELLFTLPATQSETLKKAPFPVTQIGKITCKTTTSLGEGWDHLKKS